MSLEVSPASVSGAVRYLSQVLFLHREREPGTRRDVYVVREDAWHDAIVNMRRTYAPIQAAIASGVDAVGGPRRRQESGCRRRPTSSTSSPTR